MIGVVADDITGANDIGIMFAKARHRVIVTTPAAVVAAGAHGADVLIVNTDSRLTSAQAVYASTRDAVRRLSALGCRQWFGKVCSVFRGNVGALFDAILDETGSHFAPVVLGFPKNGRTTIQGIHYVRGVELKDSDFRNDPVHPTGESSLVAILSRQTRRRVGLIPYPTIDAGPAAIRIALEAERAAGGYAIFDVRSQADLERIAPVIWEERVICGSSAIAEVWRAPDCLHPDGSRTAGGDAARRGTGAGGEDRRRFPPVGGAGILVVSGSLTPQTKAQVAYLLDHGVRGFELHTPRAMTDAAAADADLADGILRMLRDGKDAVLYASQDPASVDETVAAGEARGWSRVETSAWVSGKLAALTRQVADRTELSMLAVAGGETSGAVCRALGIQSVRILREIAPGLPLSRTVDPPSRLIVLKSGSFGEADFLLRALSVMRES